MMKKLIAALLSTAMLLSLAACGSTPASETPAAEGEKIFKIGVIQLTEHAALDAAREGFLEGLEAAGLPVSVDVKNAQGEQAICATIATKFVNDKVDLILAIATPAAQAAAQATSEIPILVTAVTDPAAAGLVQDNKAPGRNVSGTSDMNPVAEQISLLQQLVPDAKTVGVMYCSSEDNSIIQAKLAREAIEASGMTVQEFTAADSSEVQAVVQSAVGKVDAMYMPTDNLMADTIATSSAILTPAGIPIICGEEGPVKAGGTATYGISYKQLGLQTAAQAVKILKEGADITTLPIEYCNADLALTFNEEIMGKLGLTIPEAK